ncbi:MAG: hypothetical protein KYX69_00260 [Sphingomonas sp.]|uniref:hypothetical protein n=1 Tax=Sphingomonas sp. TaxID=28214 RepID=UPI00262E16A7|nr:hypothetical protein [Sphingomonas sp.]MDK2766126.1 hypothetical protein [Sphingomonas sp.]
MVSGQRGATIGRTRIAAGAIGKAQQARSLLARLVKLAGAARAGSDGSYTIRAEDGARVLHAG